MAIAQKKPAPAAAKPAAKPVPAKPVAKPNGAAPARNVEGVAGTLKEATLTVTRTALENGTIKGEEVVRDEIEIKAFATATASVSVGAKVKNNLGNYESVETFVNVTMPCYVEEMDSARAQVTDKVKELLGEAMADLNLDQFRSQFFSGEPEVFGEQEIGAEEGQPEADAGGEGEAEGGTLSPDDIRAMDRDSLVELITASELEIDPDEYPEDSDLAEMIIYTAFGEEESGGGEAAAEEPATEAYTQEDLEGGSTDDLKAICEAWGIDWPKGPEKIARKKAITAILEMQAAGASE